MRNAARRASLVTIVALASLCWSCGGNSATSPSENPPPPSSTFLSFTSTTGDFIGQGASRRFEPPVTTFSGQMVDGNRRLELRMMAGGEAWFLDVSAASGQQLLTGTYANAASSANAGVAFQLSGAGRGCSVGVSDFQVLEAAYISPPPGSSPLVSGIVERFRATFTQRCNGAGSPPLAGEVNIRSLAPNRCATPSGSC
jgi:hypothetical protein